jgi:protein SCO1/2/putative membrane protein
VSTVRRAKAVIDVGRHASLLALACLTLGACTQVTAVQGEGLAAAPYDQRRFGEVPDFRLVDASGRTVTRKDLLGAPWVANLFFTSCAGPCPRLEGDIRRFLYDPLAKTRVRLVSISVDPVHDTPEVLGEYATSFTAEPDRWLFLTGDEAQVDALARDGFKLPLERGAPPAASETDRLGERLELTHSTRLVVIDSEGRIAGYYEGGGEPAGDELAGPEEIERSMRAVLARARVLDLRSPSDTPLPLVDACLNALATVLLLSGWFAIRSGKRVLHARLMRAAFVTSTVFLACYLYYHATAIETRFPGTGLPRTLYFALLLSHVLLAVLSLPLVLRTLWLAHREDWVRHRRLARVTFPIWLYVSVTGVVVYVVLYHGRSLGL